MLALAGLRGAPLACALALARAGAVLVSVCAFFKFRQLRGATNIRDTCVGDARWAGRREPASSLLDRRKRTRTEQKRRMAAGHTGGSEDRS